MAGPQAPKRPEPHEQAFFDLTERRRSRTGPAVGYRGCNDRPPRLQRVWEMRILFGEQMISDDLIAFLRRSECITERRTRRMLEVNPRQQMLPHAARLEIEGLLRVWHRLHPEVAGDVEFVDERPSSTA
jgi:hypothetical protein